MPAAMPNLTPLRIRCTDCRAFLPMRAAALPVTGKAAESFTSWEAMCVCLNLQKGCRGDSDSFWAPALALLAHCV